MINKMNNKSLYPPISDDLDNSIDVLCLDEDGLMHIIYYSYKYNKWMCHDDRYNEDDLGNFEWISKPAIFERPKQLKLFNG